MTSIPTTFKSVTTPIDYSERVKAQREWLEGVKREREALREWTEKHEWIES